jgi:hypothetical protein
MSEIILSFDHLLTQLFRIGLKVKVLMCKLWNPSWIFLNINIFQRLHFGHRWLTHFGFVSGFLKLCHAFFERGFILRFGTYWQSSSFGRCTSCFGHFVHMCRSSTFLFHSNNTSFSSLLFFLVGFHRDS